jgi:hypothetical protein
MDYNINFTDINVTPITIAEGNVDTSTDLTLFGRVDLQYGQPLDVDMLRLLENFSRPENDANDTNDRAIFLNPTPDYSQISDQSLRHPVTGQLWYNSTRQRLYSWNGTQWSPLSMAGDYAANWGVIFNGGQIPLPQSEVTGYVFGINECVWAVSPNNIPGNTNYMLCTTDRNAVVTMVYQLANTVGLVGAYANYIIVGIKNNLNPLIFPTPTPSPTPAVSPSTAYPSPTPTPSIGSSLTPSPTPSVSITPSPTNYATPTTTPTPSPINPIVVNLSSTDCSATLASGSACGAAIVTSPLISASVTGGVPPYTYQWNSYIPTGLTFSSGNQASTNISYYLQPQTSLYVKFVNLTVTDSVGHSGTSPVVSGTLVNNQAACAPTTALSPSTNLSNYGVLNMPQGCGGNTTSGTIELVVNPDGTWFFQSSTYEPICGVNGRGGALFQAVNGGAFQNLDSNPYAGYWSATPTPNIGSGYQVQFQLIDNTSSIQTTATPAYYQYTYRPSNQTIPAIQAPLPAGSYTITNTRASPTSIASAQSIKVSVSGAYRSPSTAYNLTYLSNFTLIVTIKSNDGTQQLNATMYNFNLYLQFGAPNSSSPCTSIVSGTNLLPVQAGAACPGSGTGGGGGGGGCVALDSYLIDGTRPTRINVGELMDTFDPETLERTRTPVTYSRPELQPCVRLETISGVSLVCSESAPIPQKDGSLKHAANLTTEDQIPVMKNDIFGWEQLKEILPVGNRVVQKISCNDKCFWAGEKEGEYVLHHNVLRVKMSYSGQK